MNLKVSIKNIFPQFFSLYLSKKSEETFVSL